MEWGKSSKRIFSVCLCAIFNIVDNCLRKGGYTVYNEQQVVETLLDTIFRCFSIPEAFVLFDLHLALIVINGRDVSF